MRDGLFVCLSRARWVCCLLPSIESNHRRVMAFDGCTLTRVHFFMRRRCRRCRFRRRRHRPQVYDDERLDGASDGAF